MAGPGTEEQPDAQQDEAVDLTDRYTRALADLDNARKQYERQLADVHAAERARVTSAWLPVLDHLELALRHAEADPAAIVSGVEAVLAQALGVLADLGVTRVDGVGEAFDPARHEAAAVVADADAEPGTVVGVLRPGYLAGDRVLRPAAVAVAQGERDGGR
jgi:molecular chaperone GrpE